MRLQEGEPAVPGPVEGGLRLDRKASAMSGGNSGKAFQAGNSADSRLVRFVAGLEKDFAMPPSGKRVTSEQIGLLRAWIDQGAKWPDEPGTITELASTTHWAFQAIKRPALPGQAGLRPHCRAVGPRRGQQQPHQHHAGARLPTRCCIQT